MFYSGLVKKLFKSSSKGALLSVLLFLSIENLIIPHSVEAKSGKINRANNKSNNIFKPDHKWTIPLQMPDIRADHDNQYLCMTYKAAQGDADDNPTNEDDKLIESLDDSDTERQWVVGFTPKANSSHTHHMILYSCEMPGIYQPGSPKFVWDCSSGMVNLGGIKHATSHDHNHKRSSMKRQLSNGDEQEQSGDAEENELISFERGPVCRGQEQILFAWASGGKTLALPEKVGFRVGDPANKFLVLQVHYHKRPTRKLNKIDTFDRLIQNSAQERGKLNEVIKRPLQVAQETSSVGEQEMPTDSSGILLQMRSEGITREAGILLMSSTGFVEPGLSKHEIWCQLDSDVEMHPFRFRVHTHKYGTSVMGAKLVDKGRKASAIANLLASMSSNQQQQSMFGANNLNRFESINSNTRQLEPELIGERSPQEPEMFYEVENPSMIINQDDIIYAACYYNQTNSWPVKIGATSEDEMCNFYLMFWAERRANNIAQKACYGVNPRSYGASNIYNNNNYLSFN